MAQAQAGAAAGGQQMRVPTFVVNAGQPNEVCAVSLHTRLDTNIKSGTAHFRMTFGLPVICEPLTVY